MTVYINYTQQSVVGRVDNDYTIIFTNVVHSKILIMSKLDPPNNVNHMCSHITGLGTHTSVMTTAYPVVMMYRVLVGEPK